METAKRKNKLSKYPFARTDLGETFEIDKADLSSMKISLTAYNIRQSENISIDYTEITPGRILVTRTA